MNEKEKEYYDSSKIKPNHYKRALNNNDVIKFCQDNDIAFDAGNVIKYVARYKYKNGIEDLYKAQEYLNRLIANTKKDKYK